MKLKSLGLACIILASFTIISCDDTTDGIGTSLTDNRDNLDISTDTFFVSTKSVVADSVLSRNTTGYLGKFRDPETGAYITSNFMTQFSVLENYTFPKIDSIISKNDGLAYADSCEIRLYHSNTIGDSLAPMKLQAYELGKPVEDEDYYSNFDPEKEGYVRQNGLVVDKTYTLADLNYSIAQRSSSDYNASIRIPLNKEYTDKDGKTYKNYGTYIMRKYYENPNNFKNSYTFIHNVAPGFYFKSTSGIGAMANIYNAIMYVHFRYTSNDSTYNVAATFGGTEEVMQTTSIKNDAATIKKMAEDNSCTYVKTPAGIFTEMTIPVDDIVKGKENYTINTAKVTLQRINNENPNEYALGAPSQLLMIPADSITSFFKNHDVADNKNSYLASLSSNAYTFNNIGSMIKTMSDNKQSGNISDNWNKVVIIPVTTSTMTISSNTYLTGIYHDMSIKSTKLVGGSTPIKLTVVYSKFK
ncbi:DUF4270 domain-containing protein [Segatella paludivivens]|uniref:DUF4270 domain-containing protein n=1 Tax=Segatella paludivivens TaxID=185294 RepID=UPI00035E6829|nr:DUF4270 domain-containing protein [Segatella paludivivens]